MTSLSVVMPVYNEAAHLPSTIDALVTAVERSDFDADLVLVDDGSTDGSADVALETAAGRIPIRAIAQPNRGRYRAVREGLLRATGQYALVLGSRVRLRPGALEFVQERQSEDEIVWTGHVHIHVLGNPYGMFQNVLTEIAWRRYFDDPRPASFDLEEFDRYPKGSGCFVAPRELLLTAFGTQPTRYADVRHANDDTPMLRAIAAVQPIHVAPGFAADYEPRGSMRTFVKHSLHRGTVFFDGHGRRESRFFPLAVASFPLTASAALVCLARPRLIPLVAGGTAAVAGTVALGARRSRREVVTVAVLAPLWAASFGAGLWRGLAMHLAQRARAQPEDEGDLRRRG